MNARLSVMTADLVPAWMTATAATVLIDQQQLSALNALIALTARQQGRAEFALARDLADAFAVASPRRLSALQFLDALTWLDQRAKRRTL